MTFSAFSLGGSSSAILILSELLWGCLIWVKFVEIPPKQNFESQLKVSHQPVLYALLIKQAVSANKSARYISTHKIGQL